MLGVALFSVFTFHTAFSRKEVRSFSFLRFKRRLLKWMSLGFGVNPEASTWEDVVEQGHHKAPELRLLQEGTVSSANHFLLAKRKNYVRVFVLRGLTKPNQTETALFEHKLYPTFYYILLFFYYLFNWQRTYVFSRGRERKEECTPPWSECAFLPQSLFFSSLSCWDLRLACICTWHCFFKPPGLVCKPQWSMWNPAPLTTRLQGQPSSPSLVSADTLSCRVLDN